MSASARSWVSSLCSRSSPSCASIESRAARAWWCGSERMSAIHLIASVCSRVVTASLSRSGAHHGARSLSTSVKVSWCFSSHRCSSSRARSTTPWCRSSRTASVRTGRGSARSAPPGTAAPAPLDELLDVLVLDLAQADRGDVGDLLDHPAGVRGLAGPRRHPRGTCAAPTRSRMMSSWRKFSPTKSWSPLPSSSLRARDQRGVRDRQAQRVPEQRGHREPVGHRADHRASAPALTKPRKPSAPGSAGTRRRRTAADPRDGAHPAERRAAPGRRRARAQARSAGMAIAGDCVRSAAPLRAVAHQHRPARSPIARGPRRTTETALACRPGVAPSAAATNGPAGPDPSRTVCSTNAPW